MIPEKVRVSTGTAALLGLDNIKLKVKPTTAYLMTHTDDGCVGNCTFCPQARERPSSKSRLSRVLWPTYPGAAVLEALGRGLGAILAPKGAPGTKNTQKVTS